MVFSSPTNLRQHRVLDAIDFLLRDFRYGLLIKKLRHEMRLVYRIKFIIGSYPLQSAVLAIGAPPKFFDDIEDIYADVIKRIIEGDYPDEALTTFKALLKISMISKKEEVRPGVMADWLRRCWLNNNFDDENMEEYMLNITKERISSVAEEYLAPSKYACVHLIDTLQK